MKINFHFCVISHIFRVYSPFSVHASSGVTIDVQLSGSGVVVTVKAAGAESIRIIVRDSFSRRYTQSG